MTPYFPGTFGQPNMWDISSPSTYQHPMAPYDVLVDPLSVPAHPVLDPLKTSDDVLESICSEDDVKVCCSSCLIKSIHFLFQYRKKTGQYFLQNQLKRLTFIDQPNHVEKSSWILLICFLRPFCPPSQQTALWNVIQYHLLVYVYECSNDTPTTGERNQVWIAI